uniref:Kielin cysteine rich BMP regulator n=1 Tax=Tetraodon nigroviridis TaxID=99883 RepID=H3DPF7_TETNG
VLDLLAPLNMSDHISGVLRLQSPSGPATYRIRPRAPNLTLPPGYSRLLHSRIRGSLGVHLVALQAPGTSATLLSLSSASSPILQIISSTLNNTLDLSFLNGEGGGRRSASFGFPGRNPFSREEWVQLAVSLEPERLAFYVDCQEAVTLHLKQEEKIYLLIPQGVVVTLASTPGRKDSKFSGYLKRAEISLQPYQQRPWLCDNVTGMLQRPVPSSQPQSSRRAKEKTGRFPQDVQSDQLQRAAALGPPASPQGGKSPEAKGDQLKRLEQRLEQLAAMLEMLKTQNADLQSRVQYLEGCECVKQRCVWEGRSVEDGQSWQTDHGVCTCTSGKVKCQANVKVWVQASTENTLFSLYSGISGIRQSKKRNCFPTCVGHRDKCSLGGCCRQKIPILNISEGSGEATWLRASSVHQTFINLHYENYKPHAFPSLLRHWEEAPPEFTSTILVDKFGAKQQKRPAGGWLCRETSRRVLPVHFCSSFPSSKSAPALIDLLMGVFNSWKAAGTSAFYYWPVKHSLREQVQVYYITVCCRSVITGSISVLCSGCEVDGTYSDLDGCQTCTCKGGVKECRPLPCPSLDCTLKESVPGECCQRCKGCVHAGVHYEHGSRWRLAENPCDVCSCLEGSARCEREPCSTPCSNPAAPLPNSCCPVCQGCGVNGQDYPNGARIPAGDPCQDCTCVNGNVLCSAHPCPSLPCRNPVRRPGDCCPRCEQCEYESQLYVDGQKFSSRAEPCLHCRCSAGEVSCERVDSLCPAPRCSHPATRKGECCPTCNDCEYEQKVFADGKVFVPAGSGPCLQCRCKLKSGSVICRQEKCPPVKCTNPIIDPHVCCPICRACVLDEVEYAEGSSWHPDGPCSICTCTNGAPQCSPTRCLPTDCLHPTRGPGSCCASCESCTYNHRIYANGQRFATPEQPCHVCSCQYGSVRCERSPCPPLNCSNSYTPPGECCPKCPDCYFENRVFVDGEAFPNPLNVCEECKCVSGLTECQQTQCPRPHCNAPLSGQCCQNNCNGCNYAGKEYPNGQEFPHPTDSCRTCSCINGNVQCLKKRCPQLSCLNPNLQPGDCCPKCPAPPSDCVFERRAYRHSQHFHHPSDGCQSCACTDGAVHCQRKPCPFAACSHPILQDCCRTCEGCLHEGRERANGEMWNDSSDPCAACVCREGSVRCDRKPCPPPNCKHPVQRQCCMSCDGCLYHGREYADGTEFADGNDPCGVCYCYGGEVVCTRIPCYGDCSHPYKPAGQCCGECERCFYNGAVLMNGQSIPDPGNLCSECTCQSGSVRCLRASCPPPLCSHPVTNACGCPVCEGCHYRGLTYGDGQIFPGEDGCQNCTCSRGEVVCAQQRCPAVLCSHPALDGCACGVCDGCLFYGRSCFNGEQFPNPADRCQLCSCSSGSVVCSRLSCPSVACVNPVTLPEDCCPRCTGVCRHLGTEYQSGTTFASPSDPCSSCSCLNEVVTCQRRPCPVQCSHPVPSGTCCPVCDSCLYEGVVHTHGHTFTLSSNPCKRCTCTRGTVTCVPVVCPQTPCLRPVTKPGQCCPVCGVCRLDGREFSEGQTWTLSSNHCSTCTCQAGEVKCASPDCPKLPCMHQVTDPGTCCPRCRGCMYGGQERAEGSSWFAGSTPCISCTCADGVSTCSEIRCLSPCTNFVRVPGECCPVCADCVFEGRVYGPGDSFHPAGDPCQICTCEVLPDGEQHLRCYRKRCPSLVDCPKSNILFSGTRLLLSHLCTEPLSNCTAARIGHEISATDDPCVTCHCKDLTWTCLHQTCPQLTCPPNEQSTPTGSCCPVCKDCVIEGQNRRVANGSRWTDSDDDCITCTCRLGYIECNIEECSPVKCPNGQKQVKIPGKCCTECQDSSASCLYQGTVYHSDEQWEVDVCTSCTCMSGDVHCQSQRCPPLTCAADEMPAIVPGLCCPHCLPRPATCTAFGDPHYRTFDGRMLHFQGTCTYILANDCQGGDFSIHVTNDDRGRKGVSWTKEVTVLIGAITVQLLQDWVVKVNDELVSLPLLREPHIYVERQSNIILLNTNIGLKVMWSGRSHLEVSVPGTYKGKTCGLCGNFNNYHQDDLRMPNGQISQSEADFGNSWKVTNGSRSLSSCRAGEDIDPCKHAGYQAKKGANARCKVLKSAAFKPCHHVVPPEPWYGACVYDLCACGANTDECLCDTLEAYASRCREAGVILQWRSTSLCAVGCPVERGLVFDECGPPCPVTCFNRDVPLGVVESHCFKPCVPGCQCPAGLVLHNSYCIQPEKCPKIIHGDA